MKHKRLLGYGGLGLTLIALGVAFVKPISSSNLLIRARADMGNLSVSFDNTSTVESGSIKSSSCVLSSGLQMSGIKAYATISNSSNPQFAEISRFNGDVASVVFGVDSPATNFRSLKSIGFTYRGSYQGNMNIMWSSDNTNWTTITASCGIANQALPSGAHYLKVVNVNNSGYAYFTAFTLNYSCSDEPEEKELSSISVSGQTSEFTVGDTFSFGGTVTAHYSDSSSDDVTNSATFSGYNMSQAGEQTVTVSYTEGGINKTTTYDIEVNEAGGDVSGTYTGTYSNSYGSSFTLTFVLNKNGTGTYVAYNTGTQTNANTASFTWTYVSSTLTLTKSSQEGATGPRLYTASGTYATTNSTGSFSGTVLTITMYTSNYSSSATSITLSK